MTALPALANLRDVADATPGLARGVLLRSEAPQPGDDVPGGVAWPPGTVIDLRSPRELGGAPHVLAAAGVEVVALPMAAALAPDVRDRLRDSVSTLDDVYVAVLDVAGSWAPTLVDRAAHGPGPVLVHCAAGKDRTGIAVALLLLLAGVGPEDVHRDYARTADGLDGVYARLDAAAGSATTVPRSHVPLSPAALAAVLRRVDEQGGAQAFALAHGVDPHAVDAWRARIRS